jgi:hypothetical protein
MDAFGLLWILYDAILYDTILNDTAVAESRSHARSGARLRILDHDPIELNRIMVWFFRWSMIFSENRRPLFRIML